MNDVIRLSRDLLLSTDVLFNDVKEFTLDKLKTVNEKLPFVTKQPRLTRLLFSFLSDRG